MHIFYLNILKIINNITIDYNKQGRSVEPYRGEAEVTEYIGRSTLIIVIHVVDQYRPCNVEVEQFLYVFV